MEVRSRHYLREDEADEIKSSIEEKLDVDLGDYRLEQIELEEDYDLLLADGEPLIMRFDGEYFVTVKGALELRPEKATVTVDAGAVEFVTNGADVMRPGVVEADGGIDEGDLVVVKEENHDKPLAVGRGLTPGDDMVGDEGKVVESLHHVGDEIWEFEP
ncbi:RNA-binding protein [Halorutilales archaeon Cl-col2-1]